VNHVRNDSKTPHKLGGARFEPVHDGSYDKIVQPQVELRVPAYFLRNWVPILGPGPAMTYLQLRQMCWYDLKNPQNSRDYCWPKQKKLAQLTGYGDRSLRRYLKTLEEHDLIRRKPTYHYDRDKGKKVRSVDIYQVPYRVPLVRDHQGEAAALDADDIAGEMEQHPRQDGSPPTGQLGRQVPEMPSRPSGHSGHQVRDYQGYPPPTGHGGLGTARPDWPREDIPEDLLTNVNVGQDSSTRGDPMKTSLSNQDEYERRAYALACQLYRAAGQRDDPPVDHRNKGFCVRVVSCLDDGAIYQATSSTRDAFESGRVAPRTLDHVFQYFTGTVRNVAREAGVDLGLRPRAERAVGAK